MERRRQCQLCRDGRASWAVTWRRPDGVADELDVCDECAVGIVAQVTRLEPLWIAGPNLRTLPRHS